MSLLSGPFKPNVFSLKKPNGFLISVLRRLSRAYVSKGKGQEAIWSMKYQPSWWKAEVGLPWKNPTQNPKDSREMLKRKFLALKEHLLAENRFPQELADEVKLWEDGKFASLDVLNLLNKWRSNAMSIFNEVVNAVESSKYAEMLEPDSQGLLNAIQQILTQTVQYLEKMKTSENEKADQDEFQIVDKISEKRQERSEDHDKHGTLKLQRSTAQSASSPKKSKRKSPAHDAATPVKKKHPLDQDVCTEAVYSSSLKTTTTATASKSAGGIKAAPTVYHSNQEPHMDSTNPAHDTKRSNPTTHTGTNDQLQHIEPSSHIPYTKPSSPPSRIKPSNSNPHTEINNQAPYTELSNPVPHMESSNPAPHTKPSNTVPHTKPSNSAPYIGLNNHVPHMEINNQVPHTEPSNPVPIMDLSNLAPHPNPSNHELHMESSNPLPHTEPSNRVTCTLLSNYSPTANPISYAQTTQPNQLVPTAHPTGCVPTLQNDNIASSPGSTTSTRNNCVSAHSFQCYDDFDLQLSSIFTNPQELQKVLEEPYTYIEPSSFEQF